MFSNFVISCRLDGAERRFAVDGLCDRVVAFLASHKSFLDRRILWRKRLSALIGKRICKARADLCERQMLHACVVPAKIRLWAWGSARSALRNSLSRLRAKAREMEAAIADIRSGRAEAARRILGMIEDETSAYLAAVQAQDRDETQPFATEAGSLLAELDAEPPR